MRRLLDSHQQAQVSKGDAAFLNGLKDALVHESGLAHIGTQQYWEAVQVRHRILSIYSSNLAWALGSSVKHHAPLPYGSSWHCSARQQDL